MRMASVKVAVRVRPFNQREIDLNSQCIVEVEEKKTKLINHKVPAGEGGESRERLKEFTFDYSYWSHREGDKHFAPQVQIYEDLGTDVVSNALQGYNACVFAYGQTGSGKTFTMMGSQNNPGLIPRICEALFSSMVEGREAGTTYKVEVSYLEIYNERVKDLLRVGAHKTTHSLRVREHPKSGPYVQDLSNHIVHQFPDIQELMVRGNSHRTTASTHMNDTSSRSHAIFTVTFIQARLLSDTPLETRSKIHLVDLAGSERADATGATGQRLKEGAHINKSLVTLGSVISSLAEQAAKTGAGKNVFIPYRDSVLTWLLKDSLGGNSKTIMIATISPADVNFGETLSTLRYANRAKNIINKPTINEDPNVKLIRELREEILHLKAMLKETQVVGIEGGKETGSIMETLNQKQAKERELTDQWTERWSETHTILQEQKTLGLRKAGQGVVLDSERPHLVLIDDNVLNTGVTLYHLNHATTTIGSLPSQDIRLEGGEVLEEHCIIELHDGVATLQAKPDAQCWVNSQFVDSPTKLTQGCVIVLGGSHMFRYSDPQEAARLRKEGHRSHLNLSRLSFLSRSSSDIVRSLDNLSGVDSELEKTTADGSSFFRMTKQTSRVCETADLCEISTQTSLHTHSQPTTPIGSYPEQSSANHAIRKSSLCLPLSGEEKDEGDPAESINSTPASDTFYTATSVLSPDPHDLTSPLSPLPLDPTHTPHSRHADRLPGGAKGAFVDENCDHALKVPKEDAGECDVQIGLSHFEKDGDDMSASVYKSPRTSNVTQNGGEACESSFTHYSETVPAELNYKGASSEVDIGALLTSPILQPSDLLKPQGSPAISTEATSTPVRAEEKQTFRKTLASIKAQLGEDKKLISWTSVTHEPDTCLSDIDNDNCESHNNNSVTRNGNEQKNASCAYEGRGSSSNTTKSNSAEDDGSMEASSVWHSGLDERERSALISPEDEISKSSQVLMKLRERNQDSNISVQEKLSELDALKNHYGKLEEHVMQLQQGSNCKPLQDYSLSPQKPGKEEGYKAERPADLPLDSTLLQEDRLALLIEREVQRRVLEEVVARENAALASRPHPRRYYRSMSASADPWTLGLRVLTPSEVRPYTSMSAGFEVEGEGGNRLYQSAASADDLLLTPAPLQSPAAADYDMSCGICVCIPGYEMRGAGSAAHWEYEVKIAAGSDSWTVFRRYRRFRELHMYMCHKYGAPVEELYFPPRRLFGNFSERVVAERRGQLEVYLQQLIVLCSELEGSPLCGTSPSRTTLAYFSPFFQRGVFETSRHSTS